MKTVVLGPRPVELEALIERRRRLGVDQFDEVWEGWLDPPLAARWWDVR